jgi:hypothetical protein
MDIHAWYQVSHRHRIIARLRPGIGIPELIARAEKEDMLFIGRPDRVYPNLVDQALRCWTDLTEQKYLDQEEWAEFRKSGGTTAR